MMTRLGYLAIAKEATRAVAVKPTNTIRFLEGNVAYEQEIIANNPIQNTRWNAITAVPGKIGTDGEYTIDPNIREMGYFIFGALGAYTKTALTGGAVKHTFNTANKLPSFTFEQVQGDTTSKTEQNTFRAFGVLVDSFEINGSDSILEFKANVKAHGVFMKTSVLGSVAAGTGKQIPVVSSEGLVVGDRILISESGNTEAGEITTVTALNTNEKEITADVTAAKDGTKNPKVEIVPFTPTYNNNKENVFSFVHARFQFGKTVAEARTNKYENIENWTFSYSNGLEERYGSRRATPSTIAEKGSEAKISYTKFFETREDRDRYLDQTRQACVLSLTLPKNIGTSALPYKVEFAMEDVRFTEYKMETGTDDVYVAEMEAQVFYDDASGKALEISIWNDVADYNL